MRLKQVLLTRVRLRGFLRGLAKAFLPFVVLFLVSSLIYGHDGAVVCMILTFILFPGLIADETKRGRISDVAGYATVAILGWAWLHAIAVSMIGSLRKG